MRPSLVGGGISGLTSAIECANTGYEVLLVEKTGALGGWGAKLCKKAPDIEPYDAPVDTGIAGLIEKANSNSKITIYLNPTLSRTSGASIKRPSDGKEVSSVAFVQCAGQRNPFDENEFDYGPGHCCNTSIEQAMYFKDANPALDMAASKKKISKC